MPQVASTQQMSSIENTASEAIDDAPVNMSSKQAQGKSYSRRVVLHTTATAQEIAAGKEIEIPQAEKIFQPDFSSSDKEAQALLANMDTSKRSEIFFLKLNDTFFKPHINPVGKKIVT